MKNIAADTTVIANDDTTTIVKVDAKKSRRDLENQMRAELNDERSAEYASIIELHKQGTSRAEIAKCLDTTYSRATFVIWHHTYNVNAIPGMFAYDKRVKDAAQKIYESDVAQRKSAKS